MKTPRFGHILLATDGSRQAEAAVDVTIAFAKASAASVDVVHVWNLEVHHRHGVWDVETRHEAEDLIESTVTRIRSAGVPTRGEIMHADVAHVSSAIALAARECDADLVVVGSRALSDWQSIFTHSVSHELLCRLDRPMLIVHSRQPAFVGGSRRILVAIAGGDDVLPALRAAIAVASGADSQALVVHVAQAFVGAQGYAYVEPEQEIQVTLQTATSLLSEAGIASEALVPHAGPVAELIARIAAEWRADVVIIGTGRLGDVGSIVFGSVTHDLLRATERPLLVAERSRA